MTVLLIIFIALPGQPDRQTEVGLINGAAICNVVGRAVAERLLREAPGAKVGYACIPQVSA